MEETISKNAVNEDLQEIHRIVETVKKDSEVGGMRIQIIEENIKLAQEIKLQAAELERLADEKLKQAEELERLADEKLKQAAEFERLADEKIRLADEKAKQADEKARLADKIIKLREGKKELTLDDIFKNYNREYAAEEFD